MKYNIKVSKLEDGSYKLKINNYSRYEVEEVEALAIKYLQIQLQQKENIIKEAKKNNQYIIDVINDIEDGKRLIELLSKTNEILENGGGKQ